MASGSVITIGNFDGVHLGHQAILVKARQIADRHGVVVKALTFHPHPASVLRPGTEPGVLMGLQEKTKALRAFGADEVVALEPTKRLLSLDPQAFIQEVSDQHHPVAIVEGVNFRFGKDRRGGVDTLSSLAEAMRFEAHVVPQLEQALGDCVCVPVSSTLVRDLLASGRVADAALCLGRSHTLSGPVVEGGKRGRSIGFPTVNLDPEAVAGRAAVGVGVYAGWARLKSGASHAAAISVGFQPTFETHKLMVEAYLLGFDGDLYGQTVTIGFSRWLRDQQPFPNADALAGQLKHDVALTARWKSMGYLDPKPRAGAVSAKIAV